MTSEEMRKRMDAIFEATLESLPGHVCRQEVPPGVTAMAWDVSVLPASLNAPELEVMSRIVEPNAIGMAIQGMDWGLTHFARLRVRDREEAQVRGHMKTHKRERAFIVQALGWKGSK